jgi:serine/threonine-protein kinase
VTQIYFIGEEGGRPFFVMEFLEGKSLEALLRQEGKLPPDRAVEMLRQAASGLRAAASRGIVHRDIKPSNLVLASDGVVKVTDFGLAKSAVADEGLTLAGEVLGSPNYMSPEQASGQSADLRSDIYSLGATLYELVTGRPPFDGPTAVSIILKHAREPLRNPRQIRPDLPYPLVTLIQKMMAKRPQDRPQSYDLLLKELERLGAWMKSGGEGVRVPAAAANAAPTNLRAAESSPRSPAFWVLVPVLVLAALGGWGLLRQLRAAPRAPFSTSPSPAAPAQPPTIPPATEILSSSSEVTPPNLAPSTGRRLGIDLPPRLERLREAARANLQFVTNSHEFTPDGRLRVLGTVLNTGLARAIDIRIRISLSSSSGQILGTTEVPLVPSLLEQQQTGSFEALFPDPRQPISIRTELNWNS